MRWEDVGLRGELRREVDGGEGAAGLTAAEPGWAGSPAASCSTCG